MTIATFTPASLSPECLAELRDLWRSVEETPDFVSACALAAGTGSRILGAPLAVFARSDDGWDLVVRADVPHAPIGLPSADELSQLIANTRGVSVAIDRETAAVWTRLPLGPEHDSEWLLLLPGDWTIWPANGWLRLFAQDLQRAFRLGAMKDAIRRRDTAIARIYALTRRIARLSGRAMHQAIVDTAALVLGTEHASLAVYNPREDALAVTAVRGYSRTLVDDLRIAPGSGIVGRVFATGKPVMNVDPQVWPQRRLRYRTSSFLCVPLIAQERVVAVLSVNEPHDGRRFDRHDLSLCRWLCTSVAGAVAADQLRRECERWQHAATLDPLTGLSNRRHFEARLQEEVERARRYDLDVALLIIDVDRFKQVNDTFGHAAGDSLLRTLAEIMHRSVRSFDVCARLGGDEFAMLLPATNADNALHSAMRLCERVAEFRGQSDWSTVGLTISIGVTTLGRSDSPVGLLTRADRALYDAKARGRNTAVLAGSPASQPS